MCIVIYKPAGSMFPVSHLENSWENNSEGAGFMFPTQENMIAGYKGFMTYDELYLALDNMGFIQNKQVISECDLVIHFRFATHGGVSEEKTHPFPASADNDMLNAVSWEHSHGIAHNGVVSQYAKKGLSDTQGFIQDVLSDPDILSKLQHDEEIVFLLEHLTAGSRFIVMGNNHVSLLGDWKEDNGVYYSNTGYIKTYKWQTFNYNAPVKSVKSGNKKHVDLWEHSDNGFVAAYYGHCDRCNEQDHVNANNQCELCFEEEKDDFNGEFCMCCNNLVNDPVLFKGEYYCLECFTWVYGSNNNEED